ncbi:MAG: hypothetical protein ACP5N3_00805 [Candidatus Nanoarchaeia archaeon]
MSKKKSHAHKEHQIKEVKEKKAKVSAPKKTNQGILADAPQEHYFILCNGQPVKNVRALADALETLEDDVFNHHVTFDRNDFATWIKDIFKDAELADELAGVKDKGNTRIVLYKHIVDNLVK